VLVKPAIEEPPASNLLITTTKGRQVSFDLRSQGAASGPMALWCSRDRASSNRMKGRSPRAASAGTERDGGIRPGNAGSDPAAERAPGR